MKKRIARIVVYFGLTCLTALVLSHPYIWQSNFGPSIKGEPVWAWQQEFRARCHNIPSDPTISSSLLEILRVDSRPLRWIGCFDNHDPELLPVLFMLADDTDEFVRIGVAYWLRETAPEEQTIAVLTQLLGDPSHYVRYNAISSLGRLGPKSGPALPRLHAMLKDSEPTIPLPAAITMFELGGPNPEALEIIFEHIQGCPRETTDSGHRWVEGSKRRDDVFYPLFVDRIRREVDKKTRSNLVTSMWIFHEKSIPILIALAQDPNETERVTAIDLLGVYYRPFTPELRAALVELSQDPEPRIAEAARYAVCLQDGFPR